MARRMSLQLLIGASSDGVALGPAAVVVGRSRRADVVVDDPRVSRRHLEIRAEGDAAHVRTLDDATPFVHEGRAQRSAKVRAGARIVVGDTVLTFASERSQQAPVHTATRTRRGGIADEARALSAVTDLLGDLDASDDADAAELVVRRWATAHLGSVACSVADAAPADASAFPLGDGTRVLVIRFREPPSPSVLGLAGVAARLLGSRSAVLARVGAVLLEKETLRTAAVGSAREFLGGSANAERVASRIAKLARSDSTALILGESGTGKTFAARLIHEASARAKEPLRIINCAAIPEKLFESELFGAERGAFSGAVAARVGAFEAVGTGTLVLDEVGELDAAGQAKLLHVLEERRFERLGSNRPLRFEARVLAATNRDLAAMVEAGTFRRDLYFRISVVTLTIPPLRERGEDVVMLAKRMLADLAPTAGRRVEGFTKPALDRLRAHDWPGNVRELRNVIEHALVMGDDRLVSPDDLPERLAELPAARPDADATSDVLKLPARLDWLETQAIAAALRVTGGNRTKAAAILGINRVTLQNKLGPQKRSDR